MTMKAKAFRLVTPLALAATWLVAAKSSKKIGTEVRLAGMRPHVEEVFTISGFDAMFQIFPTPEAAAAD